MYSNTRTLTHLNVNIDNKFYLSLFLKYKCSLYENVSGDASMSEPMRVCMCTA